MEWSNEKVIEFLEAFEMEPCLWDSRLKCFKNRSAQSDAWRRIMQSLSFHVSLMEIKKKKESLMGYYRIHLNKYKKSLQSGVGTDDVYRTNWFAFEVMDSFLRPIYITNSIMDTEPSSDGYNIRVETVYTKEEIQEESVSEKLASTDYSSKNEYEIETNYQEIEEIKQQKTPPLTIKTENQINEAYCCSKPSSCKRKEGLDEYDYFAGMIASKLRKIENMDDREELMNSIHNMTFEFYMKIKKRNSECKQ